MCTLAIKLALEYHPLENNLHLIIICSFLINPKLKFAR